MGKIRDITGQRFGRLVAVRPTDKRLSGSVIWECKCDCGNTTYVASGNLIRDNTTSCGCYRKENSSWLATKKDRIDGVSTIALRRKRYSNNTTGVKGVSFDSTKQQYIAQIWIKGKHIYLGTYKSLEEAAEARRDAEEQYHKPVLDQLEERRNHEESGRS